jgi:hypothetical protein
VAGRAFGDDLARALDREPLGLPFRDLARRVKGRWSDVLRTLRTDPRFGQVGKGKGSRWRLAGNARATHSREEREQARVRVMLDLRGPWWGL